MLRIATIASCSKASDAVDPASLAALNVVDGFILALSDDTDTSSDGCAGSAGCPTPFNPHHLHWLFCHQLSHLLMLLVAKLVVLVG